VPKSRARGKKSRSTKSAAHRTRAQRSSATLSPGLPLGLFQMDPEISARRERLARRTAQEELPALLEVVGRYAPDPGEMEDGLCTRLGEVMHRCDADGGSDPDRSRYLEPDRVLGAVTSAVIEALGAPGATPQAADFEPGGTLAAPWRLWEVLREIAPDAQAHALYGLEEELRSRLAAPLPESTVRRASADSLLWACDGYQSRFLITAAFERAGQVRSYAWDVDACGYEAVTVAAGFFSSSEAAFEQWQSAVGVDATATSALAPVEDDAHRRLVAALLPDVEGFGRMGGESVEQMAEYHRSRRLAQSLRATPGLAQASPASEDDPGPGLQQRQATRFADWLAAREPERDLAFDIGELAAELADTWAGAAPAELFLTCSPHRVAAKIHSLRGFYLEDFTAELLKLLPHWVRWIAEQTALPDHLLERSLAYCDGRTHPAQGSGDRELNWYARCPE